MKMTGERGAARAAVAGGGAGVMKVLAPPADARRDETEAERSLCTFSADGRWFAIDTRRILEVLGDRCVQRVPLAPPYLQGVVPYRGEVLTTVSLRALLGLAPAAGRSCILVLENDDHDEGGGKETDEGDADDAKFGLAVDTVGEVVSVERRDFAPNPPTLDARSCALFDGAYRLPRGLLLQLSQRRLRPGVLAAQPMFASGPGAERKEGLPCEH